MAKIFISALLIPQRKPGSHLKKQEMLYNSFPSLPVTKAMKENKGEINE